jgi:nicotinate-nucleotide pyrophosphorylase (carboxylating)
MIDPNSLDLPSLWAHLSGDGRARRLLELARDEDLSDGRDLTATVMHSASRTADAALRAREQGVVSGLATLPLLAEVFETSLTITPVARDGDRASAGDTLAEIRGDLAELVTLERTMLNLLGKMCGVATMTARFVEHVRGTRASILDTRKTTPGLRAFEKYAVRCGGGRSHRLGLSDAVLIKDNHLAHLDTGALRDVIANAAQEAKERHDALFVEVEVDTMDQFAELLRVPEGLVDIALLDNMSLDQLRKGVALRDAERPGLLLEASGGVGLETVRGIAETGVDRISVGGLTRSAVALDLGLDID